MTKKKRIILICLLGILYVGGYFIYRDQTRCYEIQNRCTPYDLSTIENVEYVDFYHGLNDKCMGKCGTAKLKLKFDKWLCKYKYKLHIERSKDSQYFKRDTHNPCPYLYTISELNEGLKIKY